MVIYCFQNLNSQYKNIIFLNLLDIMTSMANNRLMIIYNNSQIIQLPSIFHSYLALWHRNTLY